MTTFAWTPRRIAGAVVVVLTAGATGLLLLDPPDGDADGARVLAAMVAAFGLLTAFAIVGLKLSDDVAPAPGPTGPPSILAFVGQGVVLLASLGAALSRVRHATASGIDPGPIIAAGLAVGVVAIVVLQVVRYRRAARQADGAAEELLAAVPGHRH